MHYGYGQNTCGYDHCYGYGYPVGGVVGGYHGGGFALIVVLFILLIIVGAAWL